MPASYENVQHNVGYVNDTLLGATRLFVGQLAEVDDDSNTTIEARRLFAAALREARLRYGKETGQGKITQKEFAKMLGISGERPEERYRLYELASREPPLWILAAIRRVTGYSLDDIIAQLPAGRRLERDLTLPKKRPPLTGDRASNQVSTKKRTAACASPVIPLRVR